MKTHLSVVSVPGHEGLRKLLSTPAFLPRETSMGATANQQQETGTVAHGSGGSACVGSSYGMTANGVGREGKEATLSYLLAPVPKHGFVAPETEQDARLWARQKVLAAPYSPSLAGEHCLLPSIKLVEITYALSI